MLRGIGAETDAFGSSRIPAYAVQAVDQYSAPRQRAGAPSRWEQGLRRLLDEAEPGSDHQLTFVARLRRGGRTPTAALDHSRACSTASPLDGLTSTPTCAGRCHRAGPRGRADEARIAQELSRDHTISGQERAAAARAVLPTAEAKARPGTTRRCATTSPTRRSADRLAFQPGQEELLQPYVERYLDVADTSGRRGHLPRLDDPAVHVPARWPPRAARPGRRPGSRAGQPGREALVREARADVVRALAAQAQGRRA